MANNRPFIKPERENTLHHEWTLAEVRSLFSMPFNDLLFQAASIHRRHFDPNTIQVSTLLSIKTGACPENCKYCPQSAHYTTAVNKTPLMEIAEVTTHARSAKEKGASRFCMGAAWRSLHDRDLPAITGMIKAVKQEGMETCMTLGMLTLPQAEALKDAGLDYYNHNIDTSPEYYSEIITTRSFDERLQTLSYIREAGIKTCCGGIVGLGETQEDRIKMLHVLATLPSPPESVPINHLVPVAGTPLEDATPLDPLDMVRTIAVARILMPRSVVRLSAGREQMSDEMQALCFLAGANSIFYGETLLTTSNPAIEKDQILFRRLGISPCNVGQEQASGMAQEHV